MLRLPGQPPRLICRCREKYIARIEERMLIELHCHTARHSRCSRIDPVALVKRAEEKNIQGVVITEHHYVWKPEELKELRVKSEASRHFLILSAQEVGTDFGHVLVFGVNESLRRNSSMADLRRDHPEAALVLAHPWRGGSSPSDERLTSTLLDGVEVFSGNQDVRENCRALARWHRLKFIATAGSDAHQVSAVGTLPTYFDHPVETIEELAEEIRNNRCRPYIKETIRSGGDTSVTKLSIGTKGEDEKRYRLVLRRTTNGENFDNYMYRSEVMRAVHEHGFSIGRYRVPAVLYADKRERLVIEEGMRGTSLYTILSTASREAGIEVFGMSARWIALLHRKKIHVTGKQTTVDKERSRFEAYRDNSVRTNNPHKEQIVDSIDFVQSREESLFTHAVNQFVQCHGDFQPQNILIGQDRSHDHTTLFVAAIDFGSSYEFPPAFDVGYFLAQFKFQFKGQPHIAERYPEDEFVREYVAEYGREPSKEFWNRIDLFRIRGNLSIINYLILIGKGAGDDVADLVRDCAKLREKVEA
ncbi:MAG: phosphotransferase [Chitinivibrionales bacterium]|nr:phosphotransferase [Chitinivibrionales bacterium]MBD3355562.1 phosphotransferase [Chitinivibrionales bacterium]